MDLLIVEPLETEITRWLAARHSVRLRPELARDPRGLRQALRQARSIIMPPVVAVDAITLHHAPRLRAIGRVGAGVELIDLDACLRAKVEVVRGHTATAPAEAEFMLGALLAMLRQTLPRHAPPAEPAGRELGSGTVGLIGMLPAARSMARLLSGFGSRVVGYDPAVHAGSAVWRRWRVEPLPLRELLEQADAVCVQLDCFSRYRGLFGDRLLPRCKAGQVIVSIGHAALFDESALGEALRSGRIAAVWLDSVEPGALDSGRPLAGIASLQVTPRLASRTRESRLRSAWEVARRIDHLLRHEPSRSREAFRGDEADGGRPTGLAAGTGRLGCALSQALCAGGVTPAPATAARPVRAAGSAST